MVKYISAKSASLNDIFKQIAPDFNSKLSAILKKASQPTWDLWELKGKAPKESDIKLIWIPRNANTTDPDDGEALPIQSTVTIYYAGTTDTKKTFYITITKTMCIKGFEDLDSLISSGTLEEYDKTEVGTEYIATSISDIENFEIINYDDWIDKPDAPAIIDLQYNESKSNAIKQSYEVPVDKIDETIQEFVDKYIDV
jgi:hypothetical protein